MDLQIRDKVALITGATGGMGFATAKILAEEGCRLVLSDLKIDQLEKHAASLPTEVLCIAADVTDQADVDTLALVRMGELEVHVEEWAGSIEDFHKLIDQGMLLKPW